MTGATPPKLSVVEAASPGSLAQLVEDSLANCRARGLSPKTVRSAYGYPLHEVLPPFCAAEGVAEPYELTNGVLDRLSNQLLEKGGRKGPLSDHSVHAYMRAINGWLNWARKQDEGKVLNVVRGQSNVRGSGHLKVRTLRLT